jgi:hypothetical protein
MLKWGGSKEAREKLTESWRGFIFTASPLAVAVRWRKLIST